MSDLIRTKQGQFSIEQSYTLNSIKNNEFKIINTLDCLKDYLVIEVDDYLNSRIKNGSILQNRYDKDIIVFKYNETLIAIYKVYEKDNTKIKPWKIF